MAKKINYKAFVEKVTEGRYTAFDRDDIIFEGKRGEVILCDYEFIHSIYLAVTDSIKVNCIEPKNGAIALLPSGNFICQIKGILDTDGATEEIAFSDFFRNPEYNARLGSNYRTLLKSLHEIGYDSEELIETLKLHNQG